MYFKLVSSLGPCKANSTTGSLSKIIGTWLLSFTPMIYIPCVYTLFLNSNLPLVTWAESTRSITFPMVDQIFTDVYLPPTIVPLTMVGVLFPKLVKLIAMNKNPTKIRVIM